LPGYHLYSRAHDAAPTMLPTPREMNTDPILRQILSSFLCSSIGTTFGISLCCASNTFLIPELKHLNHF
jgi:hypothetical protein